MKFENMYRKLGYFASSMLIAFPMFADTLNEAVQHHLMLQSDMLLGATDPTLIRQGVTKSTTLYHPGLNLDNSPTASQPYYSISKELSFDNSAHRALDVKKQVVADDLALDVVESYLQVLLQEKLLELTQNNLRLHRSVYMTMKQKKFHSKQQKAVLKQLNRRVSLAESQQFSIQKTLKNAKKTYAKVVGRWPNNLVWPETPANNELPSSVGTAIEQALDNYSTLSPKSTQGQATKKPSLVAVTYKVRASWEAWTEVGLALNELQKKLTEMDEARLQSQEKFKLGKVNALDYVTLLTKDYKAQTDYVRAFHEEALARFRILNSTGRLLPYINQSEVREASNDSLTSEAQQAVLKVLEVDGSAYPFPSYKPKLGMELRHAMDVGALNVTQSSTVGLKAPWYISAGQFHTKANAIALAARLKTLGFMVELKTSQIGASVLVGPYEYQGHALKGKARLKEIAHVQGVLVNPG